MTESKKMSLDTKDQLIAEVPEPRRAKLSEDLVAQLLRDEVDPELTEAAKTLLGR